MSTRVGIDDRRADGPCTDLKPFFAMGLVLKASPGDDPELSR